MEEPYSPDSNWDCPYKMDFGKADGRLLETVNRISLERAIEQLPPGFKAVLILHDIEGYEHVEISELLGCSIGTSKSQLHKARLKMRELLGLEEAEESPSRGSDANTTPWKHEVKNQAVLRFPARGTQRCSGTSAEAA